MENRVLSAAPKLDLKQKVWTNKFAAWFKKTSRVPWEPRVVVTQGGIVLLIGKESFPRMLNNTVKYLKMKDIPAEVTINAKTDFAFYWCIDLNGADGPDFIVCDELYGRLTLQF